MSTLVERIKAAVGEDPQWACACEDQALVLVINFEGILPCGCASWRHNEPHPGYPLREHYGPAEGGDEQFTIFVFRNGRVIHYRCEKKIATITF